MKKSFVVMSILIAFLVVTCMEASAEENVIHGCCSKFMGHLRIVKSPDQCKRWETPVSWNRQGEVAEQGDPAPAGETLSGSLAGQRCADGQFVTGFDANGDIICGGVDPCGDGVGVDCPDNLVPGALLQNCQALREADLSRASLSNANLCGADLSWAGLSDADLSGADLTNAILTGANLAFANLCGANLTNADLTGVFYANTTCPDCTNSSENGDTDTCEGHLTPTP
jgi:hypothetical protein